MLFIQNKYHLWYMSIITNAQQRSLPSTTYTERHHIIPRSYGGGNGTENIVKLTAREHLVCHMLLAKCAVDPTAMIRAVAIMSGKHTVKSRIYATIREQYSQIKQHEMLGDKNHYFGKKHSAAVIDKMKGSLTEHYKDPDVKQRIKKARTMWRHNQANKTLWARADQFYDMWVQLGKTGCWVSIEKHHNLKKSSIQGIIEHFIAGWNPLTDQEWLSWKDQSAK